MIPGRGVCAVVEDKTVLAGNPELLSEHGITMTPPQDALDYLGRGCTVTYVAIPPAGTGSLRDEAAA